MAYFGDIKNEGSESTRFCPTRGRTGQNGVHSAMSSVAGKRVLSRLAEAAGQPADRVLRLSATQCATYQVPIKPTTHPLFWRLNSIALLASEQCTHPQIFGDILVVSARVRWTFYCEP